MFPCLSPPLSPICESRGSDQRGQKPNPHSSVGSYNSDPLDPKPIFRSSDLISCHILSDSRRYDSALLALQPQWAQLSDVPEPRGQAVRGPVDWWVDPQERQYGQSEPLRRVWFGSQPGRFDHSGFARRDPGPRCRRRRLRLRGLRARLVLGLPWKKERFRIFLIRFWFHSLLLDLLFIFACLWLTLWGIRIGFEW